MWQHTLSAFKKKNQTYPVNEESLRELDHLQGDQQADGDQVIVQDDERQQVVCKISRDVTCTNTQTHNANYYMTMLRFVLGVSVWLPTSAGQVPAGVFSVFSVPDGGAHRADQRHHQQDAKQNQDLHVGHPLHVGALQRRLGGVLERWLANAAHVGAEDTR